MDHPNTTTTQVQASDMEGGVEHDQEEIDKVNVVETSAARSYDCMYCKRGFSTAQALGGHMNIHRRDRARARESFAAAPPPSPLVFATAAEEELVHDARCPAFGPAPHKHLKPLFPLVSEPSRPPPHPMFRPSSPTSSSWEERQQARDDVDPVKMEELIRYGKDLELGYKNVDPKDQQEEKENLNLRLGL